MSAHTYRALLVANSTYPADAHNLPELEGPRSDPALLRDALCNDRYGLFPADNVRLVLERTMAEVLREAEEFLRSADRRDTLLLYYSGHGKLDLSGELYLCTRDTRADRLLSTSVKASDLSAMIEESAAASTIILLDCCHSGAFKGGELAQRMAGRGRFIVTSCRTGELANDAHSMNRASMFTHHVVEGMLGAAPDGDGDGLVSLGELYSYVHARLTAEHRQIPQRSFAGAGDVPVARRAVAAGAATVAPAAEVVDPAATDPVLDVSETLIDLGQIGHDEVLPEERVAVVNRGGGELSWSAECSAGWVRVTRDQHGLLLQLQPSPGPNRANVHVRDNRTGMVKTVRLVVAVAAPPPSAQAGRPQRHDPTGDRSKARWFSLAMVGAAVAGLWLTLSGIAFLIEVDYLMGQQVFLRHSDLGPGLGASIMGGVILTGTAGAAAALRAGRGAVPERWQTFLLGMGIGLAVPLAFERLGMSFAWSPDSFYASWRGPFGYASVALGLIAAAVCGYVLAICGGVTRRTRWTPSWLLPVGAVSAGLWGIGATVPVYDEFARMRSYVDHPNFGQLGIALVLTIGALALAVVFATTWLRVDAGRGLLMGVAAFVGLVTGVEVATALFRGAPHSQGAGVLWMLVPGVVFVGAIVTGLRPRPEADGGRGAVGWSGKAMSKE